MTTTIKKNDEFKTIQTEDLAYYKSEGWVEAEKPAPTFKKAKRRFYDEEPKVENEE